MVLLKQVFASIGLCAAALAVAISPSAPRQYGANGGFGQQQGPPPEGSNPLLGTWVAQISAPGGGAMIIYTEYSPDGTSRSTSIVQGGPLNGTRYQVWGKYTLKQVNSTRWVMNARPTGQAPEKTCIQGGACTAAPPLTPATVTMDFMDANNVHSREVSRLGTMEGNMTRSAIPPQLLQPVGPLLTLVPPPPSSGGGGGGGGQATGGGRYVTPRNNIPGLGGNCDNLQQQRICAINNGHLYTDKRGCQICQAPY